jgi:hypothetical protein
VLAISPEQPQVKPKKQRRTKVFIAFQKKRIIELLSTGASDADVKQQLKMSDRLYEDTIAVMRKEGLEQTLNQQTAEAKALFLQVSIKKIQALEIEANNVMLSAREPSDKLAAMDRVRQYAIDIAKLISEGPFLFNVIQRDGLHRGLSATAAQLREPGLLQDDIQGATEPTEDPNRVA